VIQILEDTLRACVLHFRNEWIESLPYAEFAYNNNYQSSIGMFPFEALYRRICQMPLYWAWESDVKVQKSGEACLQEMNEKVKVVRENLRVAQN
jgi:hypothetical protein